MTTALPWPDDRLRRQDAAVYLGVTPGTLEVWASTKRYDIPYTKIGKLVYYRRSDLDAWINSRTVRAG